jgi:desulfoferrodoxin (superoxide reductase-like protein)
VPHGRIVVVGHGKGHSDAARHFIEWVNLHHGDISRRLVCEVVADLSSLTPPQLLDLGRRVLSDKPG